MYKQKALEIADLVTKKNKSYGDVFKKTGDVLRILYPNGISLDQYDDVLAIARILDKLFRVATDRDALDEDPWEDITGYSLLRSIHVEEKK